MTEKGNRILTEKLKDGSGFILYVDIPQADVVKKENVPMPGRVFLGVVRQKTVELNGRTWLCLEYRIVRNDDYVLELERL